MTGICGLFPKNNYTISEENIEKFTQMIKTLQHRGNQIYIYNGEIFVKIPLINKNDIKDLASDFLLGANKYNDCDFLENNYNQPQIISDGISFPNIIEENSKFYEKYIISKQLFQYFNQNKTLNFISILKKILFSFDVRIQEHTSVVVYGNNIYLIKDLLGIHPLYICENKKFTAFASERKAFWKNNIHGIIKRLNPGSIIQINGNGPHEIISKSISDIIKFGLLTPHSLINKIKTKLISSIKRRFYRIDDSIGLLYSGGLDSSLLQYYINDFGYKCKSILIGMKNSKDIIQETNIDNELIRVEINQENLLNTMSRVLYIIENPDFLTLEIAFCFYHAAKVAKSNNLNRIFAGQGADELFVGYNKYQRLFRENHKLYRKQLNYDLDTLSWQNLEACEMIFTSFGIKLMYPFLDIDLIKIVRKINPKLLINPNKELNKVILRNIALKEKLPKDIISKKKHALQYSTRIHHALDGYIRSIGFNREFSQELGYGKYYRKLFMDYLCFELDFPSKLKIQRVEQIKKKINDKLLK